MEKYQTQLAIIGRLLVGGGFLLFGYQKLIVFGPAGTGAFLGSVYHAPAPTVAAWVAIAVEILGGLGIVLVSVREQFESYESFVIQEWWPDSRRVTDVDSAKSQTLRPQFITIPQ
jgi:hypothetical protein